MSKEYTFQEVIQRIKPGQKYQCTVSNYNVQEMFMYGSVPGCLEIKQSSSDKAIMISPEARYVLVQQPVTFMEAVASKKEIKFELWGSYYPLKKVLNILLGYGESQAKATLEGKWLIKEDE